MAVEELLRYFTIADKVVSRVATEDVQIGGVSIQAGEGVIVSGLSANWDPAAFENPADLDVERGARHHLAFGFGPHQCLGQNLARLELQIVFDTLFRRIPTLRLAAPVEDLPFKTDAPSTAPRTPGHLVSRTTPSTSLDEGPLAPACAARRPAPVRSVSSSR